MPKKILIIAGEASGDLYGAHLVRALKGLLPDAVFTGVGGSKMREAGVEILHSIDDLAIIGVFEVLPRINVIKNLFSLLKRKIEADKFDAAILVNYPGFNLRFAKVLKSRRIPVIFYSSPQVWAWAGWRLRAIRKYIDKMMVFFKFEEEFYKKNRIEAEFVGHPLVDIVKPVKDGEIKRNSLLKTVSLVPGSRRSEIESLFLTMLEAARLMWHEDKNIRFLVTKHPEISPEIYLKKMERYNLPLELVDGRIHDCLKASDLAIVVSGSVTLEAGILRVPMIITNRLSFLNAIIYLLLVRLDNIGLVNIIAGKRIVPELVQYDATPRKLAREALLILKNEQRYKRIKEDLSTVNKLLGPPGASDRAALSIAKLLT